MAEVVYGSILHVEPNPHGFNVLIETNEFGLVHTNTSIAPSMLGSGKWTKRSLEVAAGNTVSPGDSVVLRGEVQDGQIVHLLSWERISSQLPERTEVTQRRRGRQSTASHACYQVGIITEAKVAYRTDTHGFARGDSDRAIFIHLDHKYDLIQDGGQLMWVSNHTLAEVIPALGELIVAETVPSTRSLERDYALFWTTADRLARLRAFNAA